MLDHVFFFVSILWYCLYREFLYPKEKRANGKTKLPKALKEGFRKAFNKFDNYQLAKYKMEGKNWSLVDIVKMVRPIPTLENGDSLKKLVEGTLKQFDTWENEISSKTGTWKSLLENNKLQYMALLRNINNIMKEDSSLEALLSEKIENENSIKNSRILPFRIYTAYKIASDGRTKIKKALANALDIACNNIPVFDGKTLVALDVSGSMTQEFNSSFRICELAGLFAVALASKNNSDFITFDNTYKHIKNMDYNNSVLSNLNNMIFNGGGTDFNCIFDFIKNIKRKYDRIFIFSDMQPWVHSGYHRGYIKTPQTVLNEYKKETKIDPFVYTFDFTGYTTTQFIGDKICSIAGFDESVFDFLKKLEVDKESLIKSIWDVGI